MAAAPAVDDSETGRDKDELRELLNRRLNGITSAGLFAYHEQLRDAPDPGLSIEGAKQISFPLTERDIRRIIAASEEERAEDEPVGNIWEVPADRVRVGNPSWDELVLKILGTVAAKLGVDVVEKGIAVAPPSLLLYQPGSVVKECPAYVYFFTFELYRICLPY